jgi:hypothetical protein
MMVKSWNDCAMIDGKGEKHDLPAFIHTFVDLRQLPSAIRKIEANGQTSVKPGLYAVAHTFDPVNPTDFNTPNVLIGRYKPHLFSQSQTANIVPGGCQGNLLSATWHRRHRTVWRKESLKVGLALPHQKESGMIFYMECDDRAGT